MTVSQKNLLKKSLQLNISLWLLVIILLGALASFYFLSPVIKIPALTYSLWGTISLLCLWLGIRNFIFKMEIREEDLFIRDENDRITIIPFLLSGILESAEALSSENE